MEQVLQKINNALARLDEKLTAKNNQFLFEKSLLGEEIEKSQNVNRQIKGRAEEALQKLDKLISVLENNGKEG